jgi:hypothetical protein
VYLRHRLLILALFLLRLGHGLLPGLVDLEKVLFELDGEVLDLLLVFALDNQEGSLGAALQRLHDDVAVTGQLVVLEFPRLLQVEVKVLIFNQLGLKVFVGLRLPLQDVLGLFVLLLDLAPSILAVFVGIEEFLIQLRAFILAFLEQLLGLTMSELLSLELRPYMITVTTVLEHLFLVILEVINPLLVLSIDISDDTVLGFVTLELSLQLPLERFDPLPELIELNQQTVVVVLQLMRHLTHRLVLSLLLVHFLPPVLLALAKLFEGVVSLLGHSLQSDVHVFDIRVQFVY